MEEPIARRAGAEQDIAQLRPVDDWTVEARPGPRSLAPSRIRTQALVFRFKGRPALGQRPNESWAATRPSDRAAAAGVKAACPP
jgi:hypothetical protein